MSMNSVIVLNSEDPKFKTPSKILEQDLIDINDIGWVDQMILLIRDYSKNHHNVLDIFAGLGTTAIAAKTLNRNAFMIEINTKRSELIQQRWASNDKAKEVCLQIFNSDTLSVLRDSSLLPPIQLCLSNLPYFSDIHSRTDNFQGDLYGTDSYIEYLHYLENCFIELKKHLSGGASCIFTCQNIRNKHGELIPLAWDIAKILQKHYAMFDERIFYYPCTERDLTKQLHTNRQHEYVFIAKKYLSIEQCIYLSQLILRLNETSVQFTVFGSFTRFIDHADGLHIGDLDLILPKDKDNLYTLLKLIIECHALTIWSWNDRLDFSDFLTWNFNKIFERHYLRLILEQQNNSSQIDLMFNEKF